MCDVVEVLAPRPLFTQSSLPMDVELQPASVTYRLTVPPPSPLPFLTNGAGRDHRHVCLRRTIAGGCKFGADDWAPETSLILLGGM